MKGKFGLVFQATTINGPEKEYVNPKNLQRPVADKEKYYEKELSPRKQDSVAKPENKAVVQSLMVSSRIPPADPTNMYLVRLPNIVAIDPRPYDRSTYVVQDLFATDSSGSRRQIPFKIIIRWKHVKNPDGVFYILIMQLSHMSRSYTICNVAHVVDLVTGL
ncbi:LEO1 homolog [Olea europaea subsp. europaea]|uniref:LEO1 homolog n=1 Tax=Olea europaea subsp. europaea TaxID=158383 RepID=A0A8S0V1S3_OLEEU|nr:LEO1 homolog [Olea europaea subsp. europaea]